MQNARLNEAWGEWLSGFDWNWWCTLTFRDEYTPAAADRAFLRWARWLQNDSPGLGYFYAHEVGDRGRLHLHSLIGGVDDSVSRRAAWKKWHDKHGRAQLLPYERDRGAGYYIAKYVSKGFDHYDIQPCGSTPDTLWKTT